MNAPHPPALDDDLHLVVGAPVVHDSASLHVAGEAFYTDDLPEPRDTLHVALDAFYPGFRQTVLRPGEFVAAVRIPPRIAGLALTAYKISKRYDQDISAVFACFALTLDGMRITSARIGCGGVAATPRRATATEAALVGQPWDEATADAAVRVLANEFSPIGDMRASAGYRRAVLSNLLRRFRLETGGAAVLTRIEHVAAAPAA